MRMTTRLLAMLLIVGGAAQAGPYKEFVLKECSFTDSLEVRRIVVDGCAYIVTRNVTSGGGVAIIHSASCTNHAPTVVVTVTQECHRAHIETRNIWLGDGKIVTNDAGDVEK